MSFIHKVTEIVIASTIRLWLFYSEYQDKIADRVEISTPINSWKKVTEGVYLLNENENPYYGDLIHEPPLGLHVFKYLINGLQQYLPFIFVLCDILTALMLSSVAKKYVLFKIEKQKEVCEKTNKERGIIEDSDETPESLMLTNDDIEPTSLYVLTAYLFNPFMILNCVAMTTTVFHNFFMALFLLAMINGHLVISCMSLAICTTQSLYPGVLICPLLMSAMEKNCSYRKMLVVLITWASFVFGLLYVSKLLSGDWDFLENVYGFILNVPDLRPNIGLFWYFFTEIFEHFRDLFISAFQINVMFLYLIPLTVRFRKDPIILSTSLILLVAVFKSYPSLGDVGFGLALIPMWKYLFCYLQQGFFVTCCFLITSVLGPVVWQLWIYARSANANFYFGVTLSFATAQIFLVTDLLFAYIKREFWLEHRHLKYSKTNYRLLALE